MDSKLKLLILKKEETLFIEGEAPKEMFLVKTGSVASYIKRKDRTIELYRTTKGHLIGEMAFFKPEQRTFSARAVEDTEVFVIPFESVKKSFDSFPVWAKLLVQSLGNQVFTYQKELKEFRLADDGTLSIINRQMIRYTSALLFCAYQSGKTPAKILRDEIKSVTSQVFLLPPNRMEQLLKLLHSAGWISCSEDWVELSDLRPLEDTLKLLRRFFLKKPEVLEPSVNEMLFLLALVKMGTEAEVLAKGHVQIKASELLKKLSDLGAPSDLTLVDQVSNRGLQFEKHLGEQGVELKFHLEEIKEFKNCWDCLVLVHSDNPFRGQ